MECRSVSIDQKEKNFLFHCTLRWPFIYLRRGRAAAPQLLLVVVVDDDDVGDNKDACNVVDIPQLLLILGDTINNCVQLRVAVASCWQHHLISDTVGKNRRRKKRLKLVIFHS